MQPTFILPKKSAFELTLEEAIKASENLKGYAVQMGSKFAEAFFKAKVKDPLHVETMINSLMVVPKTLQLIKQIKEGYDSYNEFMELYVVGSKDMCVNIGIQDADILKFNDDLLSREDFTLALYNGFKEEALKMNMSDVDSSLAYHNSVVESFKEEFMV